MKTHYNILSRVIMVLFKRKIIIFIIFLILLSPLVYTLSESKESINQKLFGESCWLLYTKDTFMVQMRDGINLATDVYLPDTVPQQTGSILIRTPYNKLKPKNIKH